MPHDLSRDAHGNVEMMAGEMPWAQSRYEVRKPARNRRGGYQGRASRLERCQEAIVHWR